MRILCGVAATVLVGCSGLSNLVDVPAPTGVSTIDELQTRDGAEQSFNDAKVSFFAVTGQQLYYVSGLMTDEFIVATGFALGDQNIDARSVLTGHGYGEGTATRPVTGILNARSRLLLAIPLLQQYEPAERQFRVGEAFALAGYAELLLAEDYCAGVPLSRALPGSGIEYGHPLSTDSLFATAEAHLDSALASAHGDTTVTALARVGLARARLGRGKFTEAAAAVVGVPTSFVYNVQTSPNTSDGSPNLYMYGTAFYSGCSQFNVGNGEGGNGLNFVSAHDPRLVTDTTIGVTCDRLRGSHAAAGPWWYPVKFGNPSQFIPLATGVEARLIEAEAALKGGQVGGWATALNALRDSAPQSYLHLSSGVPHLTDDSTTTASGTTREDVMFRERAFWLFGTGTRLGDLRRFAKYYGRSADQVFPAGAYTNLPSDGITTYGSDVSLTLPTVAGPSRITNPYYVGCVTSPATP